MNEQIIAEVMYERSKVFDHQKKVIDCVLNVITGQLNKMWWDDAHNGIDFTISTGGLFWRVQNNNGICHIKVYKTFTMVQAGMGEILCNQTLGRSINAEHQEQIYRLLDKFIDGCFERISGLEKACDRFLSE
jgi:hypothetical protein